MINMMLKLKYYKKNPYMQEEAMWNLVSESTKITEL